MANRFYGSGNLGAAPTLRMVDVDGESRAVASMRIYFDRQVPDGNGDFEDRGGFWLDVSLWGDRAETLTRLLPKGARVSVIGALVQHVWQNKETGEDASSLEVHADRVSLDLARVERIEFRKKDEQGEVTDDVA